MRAIKNAARASEEAANKAAAKAARRARRRRHGRRTLATACRRCRSSPRRSTAGTGSSASRRSSCRCATSARRIGLSVDEIERADPRAVPRLPGDAAGRSAPAARAVRDRRHGPQGRGRRQCRHAGVHRAAPGSRSTGPALPAGQGGDRVGPRGSPAEEPLRAAGRAGGAGPADDAGGERHLPGLDEGYQAEPLPVLAPAARHEGLGRRRDDGPAGSSRSTQRICGRTLARAHARSGDPVALAAYLGKKDRFDHSITDFAERYADQNEQDYQAFTDAIRSGRLEAVEGV